MMTPYITCIDDKAAGHCMSMSMLVYQGHTRYACAFRCVLLWFGSCCFTDKAPEYFTGTWAIIQYPHCQRGTTYEQGQTDNTWIGYDVNLWRYFHHLLHRKFLKFQSFWQLSVLPMTTWHFRFRGTNKTMQIKTKLSAYSMWYTLCHRTTYLCLPWKTGR